MHATFASIECTSILVSVARLRPAGRFETVAADTQDCWGVCLPRLAPEDAMEASGRCTAPYFTSSGPTVAGPECD